MGSIQREKQPSMQREDQTDHGNGSGTNSSKSAVNHLSKSVVRDTKVQRSKAARHVLWEPGAGDRSR